MGEGGGGGGGGGEWGEEGGGGRGQDKERSIHLLVNNIDQVLKVSSFAPDSIRIHLSFLSSPLLHHQDVH